jgi:hypothetical protein
MLKKTIITLCAVAVFAVALTAGVPGLPGDYVKIDDGENGFDLYYCAWAKPQVILAKVHYYQDIAVSATWASYNSMTYTPCGLPMWNDVPPGFTYEATFPCGYHLFRPISDNLPDDWMLIKPIKIPECTDTGINKVVVGTSMFWVAE